MPSPPAMPMSASRASPGPLTTHPMMAILMGSGPGQQGLFHLFGDVEQIDVAAAAGGAGDDFRPALPNPQGLQDFIPHPDLFHRVPGQGDPQGVADALGQQHADAEGGFDDARKTGRRPR